MARKKPKFSHGKGATLLSEINKSVLEIFQFKIGVFMKKILSKIKKTYKNFVSGKSGFSLVELIVVIAIMAVMAAVLAPALLGYVERSRAQKDYSAMGEVSNSVQLSLADSSVYDELLVCSEKDNYSCYADGDTATNIDANKTITKSPDLWLYNDNARKLDETVYKPAGKMRGVTVTFKPNGKSEYILKDGIVNQIGNDSTKKGSNAGKTLADTNFETLYNRIRSTVGDTLKVSSQTYRNSDYTIFISMGTTGGNESDKQDAIQVYGQYNGTNLPEVAHYSNITSGPQDAPSESGEGSIIPVVEAEHIGNVVETKYFATLRDALAYQSTDTSLTYSEVGVDSSPAFKVDKCTNGYIFTLLKDYIYEKSNEIIFLAHNTKIDINGHNLTMYKSLSNGASASDSTSIDLIVTNSKNNGVIKVCDGTTGFVLYNFKVLTYENVSFVRDLDTLSTTTKTPRVLFTHTGKTANIKNVDINFIANNENVTIQYFQSLLFQVIDNVNIDNLNLNIDINNIIASSSSYGVRFWNCKNVNILNSQLDTKLKSINNSFYEVFVYNAADINISNSNYSTIIESENSGSSTRNLFISGIADVYTNIKINSLESNLVGNGVHVGGLSIQYANGIIENVNSKVNSNLAKNSSAAIWVSYSDDIKLKNCKGIFEGDACDYCYGIAMTSTKNTKLDSCEGYLSTNSHINGSNGRGLSLQKGAVVYADNSRFSTYGANNVCVMTNDDQGNQFYISNCILDSNYGHLWVGNNAKGFIGINNQFTTIDFKKFGNGPYEETNTSYAQNVK